MNPPEDTARGDSDALYDEAPCGLLLADRDGRLLRANRTFCRWVGHAPEELVGHRRFQDLLTMGGKIFHQTHFSPLLQMQGSVSEVKLDLVCADGGTLPIVVNAVRHMREEGWEDAIAVFVAKDRHSYERELMLSRKRAEELAARHLEAQEELRRADRRKDEFLAMLAHELRNPLAPISTAAHLLSSATTPAQLARIADIIGRQAAHLTRLVDDLLDVSRVTRGLIQLEVETVELADVVESAIEQSRALIAARHHALGVRVPPACVDGDRTRLVQIVANLLNNAAKYTPQGGRIDIEVDTVDGYAVIRVSDDGLGIDAALLPHIFDLFSQGERTPDRSQGGLGIGLALVRSLVALHGGEVSAHSAGAHRGSCFTVRLPLSTRGARSVAPAPAPVALAAQRRLRVLIVDDNVDAATMLAEALGMSGHATQVADSAGSALAIVDPGTDVCVLDIGLPDLSGYELAARLREQAPSATYVALTGYGQAHDRVLSKAAGFAHHLVKPVDIERLLGILATVATPNGAPASA